MSGTLPLGEKLPSVRELSTQLTINPNTIPARLPRAGDGGLHLLRRRARQLRLRPDPGRSRAGQDTLLQQFDAAVQELLYLGTRSEELRRRIPEGGTNHD